MPKQHPAMIDDDEFVLAIEVLVREAEQCPPEGLARQTGAEGTRERPAGQKFSERFPELAVLICSL